MVEVNGLRSGGKAGGFLSKLLGLRACKHHERCNCEHCLKYREDNDYSDFGLFLGEREIHD